MSHASHTSHEPAQPTTPAPLSPRQARAERQRVWAFLEREREAQRIPSRVAAPNALALGVAPHPARKRFEVHELRRVPVAVSREAHRALMSTSAQGRIFPQALSEILGQHARIDAVSIDVDVDDAHEPTHEPRLIVTAESARLDGLTYSWRVDVAELARLDPLTRHVAFDAVALARVWLHEYNERDIAASGITS